MTARERPRRRPGRPTLRSERPTRRSGRSLGSGLVAGLCLALAGACGGANGPEASGAAAVGGSAADAGSGLVARSAGSGVESEDTAEVVATPEDWEVVRRTVEWGRNEGLDSLPFGDAVARIGVRFVGTPYEPQTLEISGPERLVVNLRALDCVTFVESVLTLAHLIRGEAALAGAGSVAVAGPALREAYRRTLTRIRYRDGRLDGYPSRLHYFSEWIRDGARKGFVREVTGDLGGVVDPEPIDFMSTHPDAYRQLADPAILEEIRRTEERLAAESRRYVPQESIAAVADGIRDGDVIAATSTVEGLDVAHTGFALWRDGRLHLLHAPLVGDSVEISQRPLADRIRGIDGQDGIMVARPLDRAEAVGP